MKLLAPCHWFCLQPAAASPSSPAIRVLSACQELFIERGGGGGGAKLLCSLSWKTTFKLCKYKSVFSCHQIVCAFPVSIEGTGHWFADQGPSWRRQQTCWSHGYRPTASGSPGLISAKPYSVLSSQCSPVFSILTCQFPFFIKNNWEMPPAHLHLTWTRTFGKNIQKTNKQKTLKTQI